MIGAENEITVVSNTDDELILDIVVTKKVENKSLTEDIYGIVHIETAYENNLITNLTNQTVMQGIAYEHDEDDMTAHRQLYYCHDEEPMFNEVSNVDYHNFSSSETNQDYTYQLLFEAFEQNIMSYEIIDKEDQKALFFGYLRKQRYQKELYLTFQNEFDIAYEYTFSDKKFTYTYFNQGAQFIMNYKYFESINNYVYTNYDTIQGDSVFSSNTKVNQATQLDNYIYVDYEVLYISNIEITSYGTSIKMFRKNKNSNIAYESARTDYNLELLFGYAESYGVLNKENFNNTEASTLILDPMIKYLLQI